MAQGFLGGMFGMPQVQQPGQAFQDPAQGMGLLGRLQYMAQNNPEALMALGSGMMQGNMGQGFAAAGDQMALHREKLMEQQERQQQLSQTQRWLMQNKGLSAEEAQMATSNPAILGHYMKGGEQNEYQERAAAAQQHGLTGEDAQSFILTGQLPSGRFGSAEVGLSPVWGQDAEGNYVLMQPSKSGKMVMSGMPEGVKPLSPYDRSFQTSSGQTAGKAVGEASGALPGAQMTAARVAQQVNDLKNDPYLPNMVGPFQSRLPNVTTDAARVQSKINQLKGGAFLEARQALKGGGAITDYEGQKAEAAYARLETAQSVEDFQAALDEFNFYVQQGLAKLQAQAGQATIGGTVPPAGNDTDPLGIR